MACQWEISNPQVVASPCNVPAVLDFDDVVTSTRKLVTQATLRPNTIIVCQQDSLTFRCQKTNHGIHR